MNRRGPNTLPCGTPEVTLTSLDICPPTLTLCVRPKRKSLIHTTTLESTPEFAILFSNRPWGTKSKALEKSTIIASILSPLSRVRNVLAYRDYLTFARISRYVWLGFIILHWVSLVSFLIICLYTFDPLLYFSYLCTYVTLPQVVRNHRQQSCSACCCLTPDST